MHKLYIRDFSSSPLPGKQVMPKELLLIDALDRSGFAHAALLHAITVGSQQTQKLGLLITLEELHNKFDDPGHSLKNWTGLGLKELHLVLNLDIPSFTYEGIKTESLYLKELRLKLRRIRALNPSLKIVPHLGSPPEQIHLLGPFIAQLHLEKYTDIQLIPPLKRTEKAVMAYRSLFEYLRIRNVADIWISFSYFHPDTQVWNMQSYNDFSGPWVVHFDISNKCTHSCTFCGLYGPDGMEAYKESPQDIQKEIRTLMGSMLDYEKGREFLEGLPPSVRHIQFGGMGDPMTHPNFLEFIQIVREKGIACEVLSNMDYFTEESIMELTRLGSKHWEDLHFVANVSGASQEMYLKTRPRQTSKNYDRVMGSLRRLSEERHKNDGSGVFFTMMCVMNRTNYTEAEDYVHLSKELDAARIYLKPMEIHADYQKALLIDDSMKADYAEKINSALAITESYKIRMHDKEALLKTIELHS